jgi:hypothetical protein
LPSLFSCLSHASALLLHLKGADGAGKEAVAGGEKALEISVVVFLVYHALTTPSPMGTSTNTATIWTPNYINI